MWSMGCGLPRARTARTLRHTQGKVASTTPFGGSRANRTYSSFFETQAGLNRIRPYSESLDRRFILMSPRVPRTPQLAVFT